MTTQFLRCAGLALLLAGCAGPIRPAVGPALSSLPDEPAEREEHLASAAARRGPETGRTSSEARQVESAAAGFAAFLGMIFSTTTNAFVGFAVPIDETRVEPKPEVTPRPLIEETGPAEQAPSGEPLLQLRAPGPR